MTKTEQQQIVQGFIQCKQAAGFEDGYPYTMPEPEEGDIVQT